MMMCSNRYSLKATWRMPISGPPWLLLLGLSEAGNKNSGILSKAYATA
jgi:hypothetical protein